MHMSLSMTELVFYMKRRKDNLEAFSWFEDEPRKFPSGETSFFSV